MVPRLARARRRRSRVARLRRRLAGFVTSRQPAIRRIALVVALIIVMLIPLPVLASDTSPRSPACTDGACHTRAVSALRWAVPLTGYWSAGTGPGTTGDGGTVPFGGQAAYVAVGGGLAVVGTGLTLTGYAADTGSEAWTTTLTAPAGAEIISVRAWSGVVTVGLLAPGGRSRTEAVLDAATGEELREYPAGVSGGAVSASVATTVIIGRDTVTCYSNATGRVRWRRATSGGPSWQADGQRLYLTHAPGSSPVTDLNVIDLKTGAERVLGSPPARPFAGTLALAEGGAVLFASSAGVTAYNGSTGGELWTKDAVPEGTDPATQQIDLTLPAGTLIGVDPLTGRVRGSVPAGAVTGTSAMYVVRGEVALGLASGANGDAWGYDMARGKATWVTPTLPWPHFFADPSGLGGSAAASGDLVVVTACPHLAASQGICADPELVALTV